MNPYDVIAADLQQLRLRAGDVSYAEIVRRIGRLREQRGIEPAATRPARTTAYDAFRAGRTRVNPQLVGEIVRALGVTEAEAYQWEERCLRARTDRGRASPVEAEPLPSPEMQPTDRRGVVVQRKLMLIVACVGLNVLGFWLVAALGLPLYLDMAGTAIAAFAIGPWAAVGVGLLTNVLGLAVTDHSSLAFAAVNIVGALLWGYGARWLRKSSTIPKYLLLNAAVALGCTVVASTLLVFIFHGGTGHVSEMMTQSFSMGGSSLALAVFQSNLIHSLVDKLVTGFIVLGALGMAQRWVRVPFHEELAADSARRLTSMEQSWLRFPAALSSGRIGHEMPRQPLARHNRFSSVRRQLPEQCEPADLSPLSVPS